MPHLVHLPGGRLALRVDADTLLAVPPMHPGTARSVQERILDYVLRRQIGLAALLAEDERDRLDGVEGARSRLAYLMGETPHKNRRGLGGMAAAA